MARKKTKLALIANEVARKNTFNKRKKAILKKMSELSTLCDVKTCGIIYGPSGTKSEVWPSPTVAKEVINTFNSLPQIEKRKKMENQEEYLRHRIEKMRHKLRKAQKENQKKETTMLMYDCVKGKNLYDLTMVDLTNLKNMIDEKTKAIKDKIEVLNQSTPETGSSKDVVGAMTVKNDEGVQVATNDLQVQPWFMQGMNLNE